MMPALTTFAAILVGYLLGSIPFGLLIARWFGKIDIRTVGSGNIGATNVGRVLGFRFFVVVFLLDFLKGYLPTRYLPDLADRATALNLPDLPVLVAVSAILGHNFPIYLRFQGGKGVATSLGSVFALDAIASLCSATGFTTFLLVTRYVSMSSILGGLVWLLAHFTRVEHPMARDQVAMTFASIGLMALLVVRHRKNLARIWEGTEPKINHRKKKKRLEGKIATIILASLAILGIAGGFALNAVRSTDVTIGPYQVIEVARVATGHQRAERLAFADHGNLLAATCPRYGRVMLYRVTTANTLDLIRDIELEGRPVALATSTRHLHVLVRPNNDARHVEEGWWETFDLTGKAEGKKVRVGFYPDDLEITPDGRHALVLTSGRGEGGEHRPSPSLSVYEIGSEEVTRPVARLEFEQPGDDPARLALSEDGSRAAVSLQGSNAIAWVDLADLGHPRIMTRVRWKHRSPPDAIRFDRSGGLLAVAESEEAVWSQANPSSEPILRPVEGATGEVIEIPGTTALWALSMPFDSGICFLAGSSDPDHQLSPATLPLKGRANLAGTRPLGLAYDAERRLLAVANRSGGSIHLIALSQRSRTP